MNEDLKLDDPNDLRILIKKWIGEACKNGELPFKKDGGIIVQMLISIFETC